MRSLHARAGHAGGRVVVVVGAAVGGADPGEARAQVSAARERRAVAWRAEREREAREVRAATPRPERGGDGECVSTKVAVSVRNGARAACGVCVHVLYTVINMLGR